jgi:hypothetical protein
MEKYALNKIIPHLKKNGGMENAKTAPYTKNERCVKILKKHNMHFIRSYFIIIVYLNDCTYLVSRCNPIVIKACNLSK